MKRAALIALGASLCLACGNDFEPKSHVVGLRVLSVRTDTPFAKPGTQAKLEMLLVDGRPAPPRATVVWIHGCVNPAGDLYYECYPGLSARLADAYRGQPSAIDAPVDGLVTLGTEATADVPKDAISSRPAQAGAFTQGRVFVFFVACAGKVQYAPNAPAPNGLPLRCTDDGGNDLGADDFVYGYAPLFVFDQLTNANPIVTGSLLPAPSSCDAGCGAGFGCSNGRCLPVIPACAAKNDSDCPQIEIKPNVDRASAELDPVASALDQKETREALWVEYAATNGRFAAGARVINDPVSGWNDDFSGKFEAYRASPGEAHLYAIVRDNRGGQTWLTADVLVQ